MPKQNRNQPPPGRSQSKHNNRHSGIAKASHNSSSSALGAAIAAARTKHSTTAAASSNLHLAALAEDAVAEEETTADQILELVRECIRNSDGDSVPLGTLGDKVRALAVRRGHHGIHKQVKEKFGGWEAFLRSYASEFTLHAGIVRVVEPTTSEMEAELRTAEPASSVDVNALSFDGAALKGDADGTEEEVRMVAGYPVTDMSAEAVAARMARHREALEDEPRKVAEILARSKSK